MEPKWLIGGPESTEQVTTPQQSAQKPAQNAPEAPDDDPLAPGTISEVFKPLGRYKGKTAAQWRALAQGRTQDAEDSFERCDTDGFVTQFAATLNAREYDLCARLAEKNGIWEFPALFTLTGALAPATYIKTSQGRWVWRIGTGHAVTWFNKSKARKGAQRRANDRAKGFMVGLVRARAYVGVSGSGKGFSGLASVGYFIGQVKDSPVEIIDDGSLGTQYQDY